MHTAKLAEFLACFEISLCETEDNRSKPRKDLHCRTIKLPRCSDAQLPRTEVVRTMPETARKPVGTVRGCKCARAHGPFSAINADLDVHSGVSPPLLSAESLGGLSYTAYAAFSRSPGLCSCRAAAWSLLLLWLALPDFFAPPTCYPQLPGCPKGVHSYLLVH